MITCHLAVLLAQRKMNRKQLSDLTGTPLNSLKPLYYNTQKGVHMKTIDRICRVLDISVGELFEYTPEQPELFEGKKKV